jgi:hypothetical protein
MMLKQSFELKFTEQSVPILPLHLEYEGTDRWAMKEQYSLRRLAK